MEIKDTKFYKFAEQFCKENCKENCKEFEGEINNGTMDKKPR